MNKLLVPLIGTVAALAVAFGGVVVGAGMSPVQAPQVESVPILEPISVGGSTAAADAGMDTTGSSLSNGVATIVTPGAGPSNGVPVEVETMVRELDAVDGLDDPAAREVLGDPAASGGPPPGDPCAPEPATDAAADCPTGLRSAIFALTEPEPLRLFPRADPPAEIAGSGGLVACPPAPDGSLAFGVATTTPSAVTLRYWPTDDPAAERSVSIPGLPADRDAWDAEVLRVGGFPAGWGLFQHCTELTGLRPNTEYESSSFAFDILDRISSPVTLDFDSRGAATRPPMVVVPLTSSHVYVSVPTTMAGPLPWLRAWVIQDGEPADCSSFDSTTEISRVTDERVVDVTESYLSTRNYHRSWSRRVSNTFSVPEGSTVVFCARWFDVSAPSWSRDLPRDQVSALVSSPDMASPVVRVTSLALTREVEARSIRFSASTQFGVECDFRAYLPRLADGTGEVDSLLCAPGRSDGPGDPPLGSGGNIVITSRVGTGAGALVNSTLLPLERYGCLGACPLPPTLTFEVVIPAVQVNVALCYNSSDCPPPTGESAFGTATITVSWEQGQTNGLSEWQVGTPEQVVPAMPVPVLPQLDVLQNIADSLSSDGFEGIVRIPIRADRHVTYRASVAGDCFSGDVPLPVEGETFLVDGFQEATAVIAGLCPGESYWVTVELTDDEGRRALYGFGQPGGRNWVSAHVRIGQRTREFAADVRIMKVSSDRRPWWVPGSDVTVGDFARAHEVYLDFPDDTCMTGTELSTSGTATGTVLQERSIHVSVIATAVTEGMYDGTNRDANCSWRDLSWHRLGFEADLTFAEFQRGVTVTLPLRPPWARAGRDFDPEFEAVITLRLAP